MSGSEKSFFGKKSVEHSCIWELTDVSVDRYTVVSPTLKIGPYEWVLSLRNNDFVYLSISLDCNTNNHPLEGTHMHVVFSILNKQGFEIVKQERPVIFEVKQKERTFEQFVEYDYFFNENNGLLANGRCVIKCKLYFFSHVFSVSESPLGWQRRSLEFDDFEKLLDNKAFSDVKLIVGNKYFQAHKNILATRSRVFSAMFQHEMKENRDNTVEIKDIKSNVMKEVLRFIYIGKVDNIETMGKDLFAAAHKYELRGLKILCEEALIDTLNINNVGKLLIFADMYEAKMLKTHALRFILTNKSDIDMKALEKEAKSVSLSLLDFINLVE